MAEPDEPSITSENIRAGINKEQAQDASEESEYESTPQDETQFKVQTSQPYWHGEYKDVNRDLILGNLSAWDKERVEFLLTVGHLFERTFSKFYMQTQEGDIQPLYSAKNQPQIVNQIRHDVAVILGAGRGFLGYQWDAYNTHTVRKEHKIQETKEEGGFSLSKVAGRK